MVKTNKNATSLYTALFGLSLVVSGTIVYLFYQRRNELIEGSTSFMRLLEKDPAKIVSLSTRKDIYGQLARFTALAQHINNDARLTSQEIHTFHSELHMFLHMKTVINLIAKINNHELEDLGYLSRRRSPWIDISKYLEFISLKNPDLDQRWCSNAVAVANGGTDNLADVISSNYCTLQQDY